MWPSILAAFPAFTAKFEGYTTWMYLDVRGLVTTAVGLLIDPVAEALGLPWLHRDGTAASPSEITAAWTMVKANQGKRLAGGGAFAQFTTLRLSKASVDAITVQKMQENENVLHSRFTNWDTLPADAQLAVHSLAWACGPGFDFPKLEAALAVRDWATCAVECQTDAAGNPGLVPRNLANKALFLACLTCADPSQITGL